MHFSLDLMHRPTKEPSFRYVFYFMTFMSGLTYLLRTTGSHSCTDSPSERDDLSRVSSLLIEYEQTSLAASAAL